MAKVLALHTLGSCVGAGSHPSHSAFHPCLWPGKAVEDGPRAWDSAPMWGILKKLLAPGSWLLASDQLSSGHYGYVGSGSADELEDELAVL